MVRMHAVNHCAMASVGVRVKRPTKYLLLLCLLVPCWKKTNIVHELVQAKKEKSRQPRMVHALLASRMSSCWPPWTVEEGDVASLFVKDLGLALAPNMSRPITDLQRGQQWIGIYCRKKEGSLCFWTSRFQVIQCMFVRGFAPKIEELTT